MLVRLNIKVKQKALVKRFNTTKKGELNKLVL